MNEYPPHTVKQKFITRDCYSHSKEVRRVKLIPGIVALYRKNSPCGFDTFVTKMTETAGFLLYNYSFPNGWKVVIWVCKEIDQTSNRDVYLTKVSWTDAITKTAYSSRFNTQEVMSFANAREFLSRVKKLQAERKLFV